MKLSPDYIMEIVHMTRVPSYLNMGVNKNTMAYTRFRTYALFLCTEVIRKYHVRPFPKFDTDEDTLTSSIVQKEGHPIFDRKFDDKRAIILSFPRRIFALVIHKSYMINPYNSSDYLQDNIYIECTLIREDLVERAIYTIFF